MVGQPGGRLDLAAEALARLGEAQVLGSDQLERDVAVQRLLPCEEHDPHPSRTQPLEEAEVAQTLGETGQTLDFR